jgi:hypothetical protein
MYLAGYYVGGIGGLQMVNIIKFQVFIYDNPLGDQHASTKGAKKGNLNDFSVLA